MVLLAAFVCLFVWHEIEEYVVLVPWFAANRSRLPAPARHITMNRQHFTLIAVEELICIVLVGLFLDPVWLKAAAIAYTIHLALHCGQLVVTWAKGFLLPLWSAPIQLPLAIDLILGMPTDGKVDLLTASLIMTAAMIANLALMHLIASKVYKTSSPRES
ncbi:HXXEE domain-containing protein [Trueperella pyogenes]|uniref:HXXEE domain-containing protein n=1 Tax=Trueperella pyogenes TaxID=1661 RepID=UPI00345C6E32